MSTQQETQSQAEFRFQLREDFEGNTDGISHALGEEATPSLKPGNVTGDPEIQAMLDQRLG